MSTASPLPEDDDAARAFIDRLDARAERIETGADGARMVWRAWGRGPSMVLLHGGSGSWTHWIRNIPHFMRYRRVLAADLPGLGDSPPPPEPYTAESLAAIVAAGMSELLDDGEPTDLVGFSFGGILAGHVAGLPGLALRRLVIVGSPPFGLGSTGPANQVDAVDPALPLHEARGLHRRNLQRLMFAHATAVSPLSTRVHHDNLRRARLRSRKIARTDTLARALRRCGCPRHGIWGGADVTIHPDLAAIRALFMDTPYQSSFDVLPDVGHWAPFEAPGAFNTLLEQRLATPPP
jgi:pimeloyl-ACP methyl ester carboxylesterase